MADTGNNIGFEITADEKKLKQGVENAQKALKSFITKAEELGGALRKNAIESANLADKQSQLKSSFDSGSISADKYEREMADITAQEQRLSASTKTLNTQLANTKRNVKALGAPTVRLGQNFDKNAKALNNNGIPAMTSFSQVIQDAPYGMRGMANNIQQMTMQLGYLSKSAGGAKGALKAMLNSLAGPAGILLAVSIVTSLLVKYGDNLIDTSSKAEKLAKANKKITESLESTSGVLSAQIGSLDAQIKLVELQGGSTKALLDQKLKLLEAELLNNEEKKSSIRLQLSAIKGAEIELGLMDRMIIGFGILKGINVAGIIGDAVMETADKIKELETALANAEKSTYNTILAIGKIKAPDIYDPEKAKGNVKKVTSAVVEGIYAYKAEVTPLANEVGQSIIEGLVPTDVAADTARRTLSQHLNDMYTLMEEFDGNARELIVGSISSTFANLGSAIGEAIATGGNVFEEAGKSILSSIGGFLSKMGEMLIEYGTLAVTKGKLDLAILAGGPVAIGAGLAAIAVGVALAAIGSAMGSFASSGGEDSADHSTSKRKNYGSSSSYGASGGGGGTYVFEIAGTKLVGVLKNTLDRNKALGGSLSIT